MFLSTIAAPAYPSELYGKCSRLTACAAGSLTTCATTIMGHTPVSGAVISLTGGNTLSTYQPGAAHTLSRTGGGRQGLYVSPGTLSGAGGCSNKYTTSNSATWTAPASGEVTLLGLGGRPCDRARPARLRKARRGRARGGGGGCGRQRGGEGAVKVVAAGSWRRRAAP